MRDSQTLVREEKLNACWACKKRTVHVKLSYGWKCLPCAKKEIKLDGDRSFPVTVQVAGVGSSQYTGD